MTETSTDKQPPIDKIKSLDGSIIIPIWRNENTEGKISYSLSEPERTYYDKQSEQYKTTTTMFDRDALELSKLYSRAHDRLRELREADYQYKKIADDDLSSAQQHAA
jgi:hypothetical protein